MSGAAGGVTINKEDLKATIRDYRDNILKPLGLDTSYTITGVRSRPEKDIFGDIDIVVSFPEGDKKELKQQLASFLTQNDKIPIIPSKNKKYFIHGNIVSTLYPITNKEKEYVQIDNIVTVTKEEGKFTFQMLDLPAQEQTLAIGLAKTIFTELDEKQIEDLFNELNITNPEKPGEGEEYDFNLNPSELTLRIVPIGKNDGKQIWKSNTFEDVKKMLLTLNIDIKNDKFETIIQKIKGFKNRRSIDRLKGMYAKNIRVGDAEAKKDKGIKKQQSLDTVAALQEKYSALAMELINPFLLEDKSEKIIAVFPGKFKPPHKDHIARIKAAANDADEVIVLISPKTEPGGEPKTKKETEKLTTRLKDEIPITSDQSLAIFKAANLPSNVKVMKSNDPSLPVPSQSPVTAAYEIFINNPNQQYIGVFGKGEDLSRFKIVPQNTTIKNYDNSAGNLSATDLRIALKNGGNITPFLPDGISPEEYKQALKLSLNELEDYEIKYWALHADLYKALKDNPDEEYKILKNELKGERLKALNYFYYSYLSKDAPKKFSKDKEQKLRIFDFDDTLAHVNATIYITHKDGTEEELTPAEYAVYEPQSGDTSNFREFNAVIKNASPIEKNINLLKQAASDSNTKVTILTARGLGYPVKKYLKDEFNLDIYVVALGSSDPQKKAEYIEDQIKKGYSDIEFIDDSTKNVNAVNQLKLKYPDIRLNAEIAENILLENTSFQPLDFKTHLTSLTKYMVDQGMNIKPYPALKIINNDFKNAENMLGKTAYYDPTNCSITLYTLNRHPKDILRSYAHEMIHRMQDNEGRLKNITTTNTNKDGDLEELEKEAYLKGNMCFRNWEDTIKTPLNEWVANILKYKHLKL